MNLYKVAFDNNVAASAEQLYVAHHHNVSVETVNGKRIVNWITIFADDERESIRVANRVVNDFFTFLAKH